MVAFLRDRGSTGAFVLEIGGGVGAIQLELLSGGRGARRRTSSSRPSTRTRPRGSRGRRASSERVERRLGDVVAEAPALAGEADAVVMHRVVCCYPDYDALVGAASERARRYLVMSFPRPRPVIRIVDGCGQRSRAQNASLGVPHLGAPRQQAHRRGG